MKLQLRLISISNKLLLVIFYLIGSVSYGQFQIPQKPKEQQAVYDYANLLSLREKKALQEKLINYADTTSTQIVVAIVPNLQDEYIGTLAPQWAHQWGIGQKDKDNGVFILLSRDDRKIWIAPGYGLEHLLTAGVNGDIIRKHIIPHFKTGNYFLGIDEGTTALIQLFSGAYTPSPKKEDFSDLWGFIIFLGILLLIGIIGNKNGGRNNRGRGYRNNTDFTDFILLSGMGSNRGNWNGGGFGSGGFSGGFGGGGFSGGGAGGSW